MVYLIFVKVFATMTFILWFVNAFLVPVRFVDFRYMVSKAILRMVLFILVPLVILLWWFGP